MEERFGKNHFSRMLGLELISANDGNCEISLRIKPEHLQNAGFVHGGILATIADVAMGFAASSAVPENHHVLTGELKISYLNPAVQPVILAKGFTIKAGRKIVFVEAEIYGLAEGGGGKLVAKASSSMVVVSPEEIAR